MKLRFILVSLTLGLLACTHATAQDAAPAATPPTVDDQVITELVGIVDQIKVKLRAGQDTAADLTPELALFDTLLAKYAGRKTDAVASVALMHAALYLQVLHDEAKARELFLALKADFPGTEPASKVDDILTQMDNAAKAEAAKAALVGQTAPELHFSWASRDGLKTLSGLKGKVVVLDFWATWCGPCIASFPQIREHVAHFAGAPVEFIGVTSIQGYVANMGARIDTKGNPAKEMALMSDFMKAKEITWTVAFSEEQVFNPAYGIEGIPFVAIIAPDGTVRHAGLHPGDPASEIEGKITALLKEFNLPLPAQP